MKKIVAILSFILLSLLWFSSVPTFAQGDAGSSGKEVAVLRGEVAALRSEVKAAKTRETEPSPEVLVLRAQPQTMKDYDQKIIAVVYWALGAVFVLGGLLVAYKVVVLTVLLR